jgi:hypothetical protein
MQLLLSLAKEERLIEFEGGVVVLLVGQKLRHTPVEKTV